MIAYPDDEGSNTHKDGADEMTSEALSNLLDRQLQQTTDDAALDDLSLNFEGIKQGDLLRLFGRSNNGKPKVPPKEPPEMPPETPPEIPPDTTPELPPETAPEVPPDTTPEVPPETPPEMPPQQLPEAS